MSLFISSKLKNNENTDIMHLIDLLNEERIINIPAMFVISQCQY